MSGKGFRPGPIPAHLPPCHLWEPRWPDVDPDSLRRIRWTCRGCGAEAMSFRKPAESGGAVLASYVSEGRDGYVPVRVCSGLPEEKDSLGSALKGLMDAYNTHVNGQTPFAGTGDVLSSDCDLALVQVTMAS